MVLITPSQRVVIMKRRSGFTLVETSIVVAIIGLLSAVAIPSFSAVRAKSLSNTKKANVRQLNNAVQMWAMDALALDNAPIGGGITNYIKGGIDGLVVGASGVNITNITMEIVSHTFTVADLY